MRWLRLLVMTLLMVCVCVKVNGSKLIPYYPQFHGSLFTFQNLSETVSSDTIPDTEVYPARGLVLSLAIPGAGQWYAGAKKKALIFAGMETAGLFLWYQMKKRGEDLQYDFEDFADEHWDLKSWVDVTPYLYAQGEEYRDIVIDGTHHLRIIVEENILSSDTLASWQGNLDEVDVIRDLEFYENIGKYDQFVSGWDDIFDENGRDAWKLKYKDVGDTTEVIVMTKNKKKYLNIRRDSNTAFRSANYIVSAIMLNHVISAIDAFWETRRQMMGSTPLDISVRPLFTPYSRFGVGGISFSVSW